MSLRKRILQSQFRKMFVPGGLMIPKKIAKKNTFCANPLYIVPEKLILDGYNTPVENQGSLPYCAAYSASSFAENILWRKTHIRKDIDPVPLYKYAKTIDGSPDTDGTFLECTLEALLKFGYFEKGVCKIKTFGGNMFSNLTALRDLKSAIHQYGCCLAGFNITTEWYSPSHDNTIVGGNFHEEGGHAVLIVGYDQERVRILNSWGKDYADGGFVWISNDAFSRQFIYGAILTHCMDD